MSQRLSDRIAGVLLLIFASWYGLTARSFNVNFIADPVGPKAFPFILAVFMGLSSLYLIFKPDEGPTWPPFSVWLRIILVVISFVAYAYMLVPLGFILATTLELASLSLIFRGPPLRSLMAALLFSLVMYALFAFGLELGLPTGRIFSFLGV